MPSLDGNGNAPWLDDGIQRRRGSVWENQQRISFTQKDEQKEGEQKEEEQKEETHNDKKETESSNLMAAVEKLKKAGLSKIGNVVQTTSPEYLDAASLAGDSYIVDDGDEEEKNNEPDNHSMNSVNIHIFASTEGDTRSVSGIRDTITMSIAESEELCQDIESVTGHISLSTTLSESMKEILGTTETQFPPPKNSSSKYSFDESLTHCTKGKDLWASGDLTQALSEFRKALLGLESLVGTNHMLVSKIYHWLGQIFLRQLEIHNKHASEITRRAWADAAVESLAWALKIQYTQQKSAKNTKTETSSIHTGLTDDSDDSKTKVMIENLLEKAWKIRADEWPNSSSTVKTLDDLKDSIRIEKKADLALFRLEKNQLSSAIDVYASLVNQYSKAISTCDDDGGFSAMTKMAFWYHKLGRLRASMDKESGKVEPMPPFHSFVFMPLDVSTDHKPNLKKDRSASRAYLEHAAFWYRMALEAFCTSIGRFDKTSDGRLSPRENIDITSHPTYKQLLQRLGQVLSDHHITNPKEGEDKAATYLGSLGVYESVLHHFGGVLAMKHYKRLNANKNDTLKHLHDLKGHLVKAHQGYRSALMIEERTWGSDHQIVMAMRAEERRATSLRPAVDLAISEFPSKQAEKQREAEEKRRQNEKLRKEQQEREQELRDQELDREKQRNDEYERRKREKEKQKQQRKRGFDDKALETLRRLQDEVYEYKQLLGGQDAEKDQLRADLTSKTTETIQALATAAQKKEEAGKWKRNYENAQNEKDKLLSRIYELEREVTMSTQKRGQLEFDIKREEVGLLQSSKQKDVELEFWKKRYEIARNEFAESQNALEEELIKAKSDAGVKQAELIEWRGKFEGLDSEWKSRRGQVDKLSAENNRLKLELKSNAEQLQKLEHSKKINNLEFAKSKEEKILHAMTKAAESNSEAASWKRKFEVSQKEWLLFQEKSDEQARLAIADAAFKTSELARWKKKFEIAQREWMECQTRAERQAMAAISSAKRYEVAHTELADKFTAAQKGLKSLLDQNKQLKQQVSDSKSKQDQLEFSMKKQAIDYAQFQDALNRKTAEAQCWKDQCQATQQAQNQFTHEIQLSRATDGNLHDRIIDLRQQVADLKERNAGLQGDQDRKNLELEEKQKEIETVKDAALKRIRQLKDEKKQLKSDGKDEKGQRTTQKEGDSDIGQSGPSILAAKLARTQRALEFVEKDHKEGLEEIESLTKNKKEMEEKMSDAQKIISLLKNANNERIEQCTKLENENKDLQQQLERSKSSSEESDNSESGNESDSDDESNRSESGDESDSDDESNRSESGDESDSDDKSNRSESGDENDFDDESNRGEPDESDFDGTSNRSELGDEIFSSEDKAHLKKQLKKSVAHKDALLAQVKKLESQQGGSRSDSNQELNKRIAMLQSHLEESELRNEELLSQITKLQQQPRTSFASPMSFASPIRPRRRGSVEEPEEDQKVIALEDRCEELERELCLSTHQIEDLQDAVRDFKRRESQKSLGAGSSHGSSEFAESDQLQVNATIKTLKKRCEELERDLVVANHKIEDLQDEYHESRHTRDTKDEYHNLILAQELERELDKAIAAKENLSTELEACEKEIQQNEEKEKMYKRQIDDSGKQIRALRKSVKDLSSINQRSPVKQNDIHLALIEDLEVELEESNEIRKKITSELDACKLKIELAEKKEQKIQTLNKEYGELEEKLEKSNQIREELTTQVASLKKRLARAEAKEDKSGMLEDKLEDLEDQLEESNKKNDRLQSQIDEFNSSVGKNDRRHMHLTDQLSNLEEELGDSAKEIRSLKAEINRLEKESEKVKIIEEEKEELMDEYKALTKKYKDAKEVAEQNSKSLSTMQGVDDKELERVHQKCATLEEELQESSKRIKELEFRIEDMSKRNTATLKDLEDMSDRKRKLESKVDELRKQQLERLESFSSSDGSKASCEKCNSLTEELRSTVEQNQRHIKNTVKFQDEHDELLEKLRETMEQNEKLESQLKTNSSTLSNEALASDDKYQDLNIRVIELEEQLSDSKELCGKRTAQLDALKLQINDLEEYADDTASDLEQAESIIAALKAEGAGGGAEVTLLLDRCNKLQSQLKEAQKSNKKSLDDSAKVNTPMKDELQSPSNKLVANINLGAPSPGESSFETAIEKDIEELHDETIRELNNKFDAITRELTEELNTATTARDELAMLLQKEKEDSDQQKRLNTQIEKERKYLDTAYNECKKDLAKVQSDLEETQGLLKKSNDEKEELERQLEVEKHVSQSLKTSKENTNDDDSEENELEELYRQARDEMAEVEGMLFETEEELEELKKKHKALEEKVAGTGDSNQGSKTNDASDELLHDLEGLTSDELKNETRKAMRKLQETQLKVADLQETNMILQAQLKSSLNFKERNKAPPRRTRSGPGFWTQKRTNSGSETKVEEGKPPVDKGNSGRGFWGFGGRTIAGDDTNNEAPGQAASSGDQ